MFYEGIEKKVELIISTGQPSLRRYPELWPQIIRKAKAEIISKISNEFCDAYLLSESSLFLYDNRFIMITCGKTTLIQSVIEFLNHFAIDQVQCLIYERKNEHFPKYQPSTFIEDAILLTRYVPGKAFRLGNEDEHHIFLFHIDKAFSPPSGGETDVTLEILMHGFDRDLRDIFLSKKKNIEYFRSMTNLQKIFPNFQVDDYVFNPAGYSLNAIKRKNYYTLHITPQVIGSYVSFETNFITPASLPTLIKQVLSIFKPCSFDIILFQDEILNRIQYGNYVLRNEVRQKLSCGYTVQYFSYFEAQSIAQKAFDLPLDLIKTGEKNVE